MSRILTIMPFVFDESSCRDYERTLNLAAASGASVEVVALHDGPCAEDFEVPGFKQPINEIVELVSRHQGQFDGIMISCFEDPGLLEAWRVARIPVAGPCETAMLIAKMAGANFFVVSPDRGGETHIRGIATTLGVAEKFQSFNYVDLKAGSSEPDLLNITRCVVQAIEEAGRGETSEIAILGCTAFAGAYAAIQAQVSFRVIEPATAAIALLEQLISGNDDDLARAHRATHRPLNPNYSR